MDWQTHNAIVWFGTGLGLYLLDKAMRKYRPFKFAHDYLWRRVKSPRLRKFLFMEF